jgi:hypothetical protein
LSAERRAWLLVFPVFTHVLPEAFEQFLMIAYHAGRDVPAYDFHVAVQKRQLLHTAMNATAEAVVKNPQYAGLITFDDDCLPPPDCLSRLIAHYEAGHHVISGLGYMRGYPYTPTMGRMYPEGACLVDDGRDGMHMAGFQWVEPETPRGVMEVDFSGMPVTLIARDVLLKMEEPYFQNFLDGGQCTHDVYFCHKAKAAGVPIAVDTAIDCGHLVANPIVNGATRAHVLQACAAAAAKYPIQQAGRVVAKA